MKNNTINKKEIEKFSKIAEEWWNPQGKFKPLHKFNPIRIRYIRDNIIDHFAIIFATLLILSVVPTEVPPNFKTIIFIDNYFLI